MTRQTFGVWARSAIGAAALVTSIAGCGTPPGQFVIIQNQVPETAGGGCLIPSTLGTVYRGEGAMDVRLVRSDAQEGYVLFPVMQNNYPSPQGQSSGDPNRIALTNYQVDVTVPDDAPADEITNLVNNLRFASDVPDPLVHYSAPTSGSVTSGGGNTAGAINVIPAELARRIRATGVLATKPYVWIYVQVRSVGRFDGTGSSVESDSFRYPIRVCDGCMTQNVGMCPVPSDAVSLGNPCNIAQDGFVTCCSSGTGLVCPASVEQ